VANEPRNWTYTCNSVCAYESQFSDTIALTRDVNCGASSRLQIRLNFMSGRYVTKCVSAVGYELNSIADESGEVNLAHNSSYFDELPDIQLSIATLTFALYNCLAKSGSLAVIAFAANFFDSVIVADECDRAIPARRCCWLRETILQHGREGRRGRSGKGKMINSVNCIRPVWT